MKCLRFKLETPYLVNFRKPFSTITLLSYPFPPYTTIRGLLANALGLGDLETARDDYNLQLADLKISLKPLSTPERFQDMALMKKLKPPADSKKRKDLMKKLEAHGFDLDILEKKERELYERLRVPQNTSAPFVKEYITPIECLVFILGEENNLRALKDALKNPERPLYIGGSDDFVIISVLDDKPISIEEIESAELDSIVRINGEVTPIDKKRIVGRVPYRFTEINKKKRDYSREDVVVAAPIPGEKLKLTKPIRCFKVIDDNVAF
jgi:CRISPR-associated protein Cas5h